MARNGQEMGSQNHCVDSTRAVRGTCCVEICIHCAMYVQVSMSCTYTK